VPQFGVSPGEHQWLHAPDNVQRRLGRSARQTLRSSPVVLRWPGNVLRKHHVCREQLLDSEVRERFVLPIFDGTLGGRYLPDQAVRRHLQDAQPDHTTGWGGGGGGGNSLN